MGFYKNENYPVVHRLSDPLLIRIDAYSLQVGETTFFAKIKFGQAFRGYLVYASGLNVPIYTYDITNGASVSQDYVVQNLTNVNLSSDVKVTQIQELAKGWIDVLQETILEAPEGDSLKSAIDRFNWQIHKDITGSDFDMKELEGFSNVTIDDVNESITVHGVVTDTSNNTKTAINGVASNISDVASNLRGEGEYTISKCLRDTDTWDESVSCSVKEQTELERTEFNDIEDRIGNPITTGENPESLWSTLKNINGGVAIRTTTLYDLSDKTHETVGDRGEQGETLYTLSGKIHTTVGDKPQEGETIYAYTSRVGSSSDGSGNTLFGKLNSVSGVIGSASSIGQNTIMGTLDKIHMSMYGSSDSGGSYYGFVEGPNQVGSDRTIIVKSRTV